MLIGYKKLTLQEMQDRAITSLFFQSAEKASDFPFRVYVLENALIDQCGTVFCAGFLFKETTSLSPIKAVLAEKKDLKEQVEPCNHLDEAVIACFSSFNNYFHFQLDLLLPYVAAAGHGFASLPVLLRKKTKPFQRQLLKMLPGLHAEFLAENGYTLVKRLHYVSALKSDDQYNKTELLCYRDALLTQLKPADKKAIAGVGQRIFLSRAISANRRVLNVAELEQIAQEQGFQVVYPEQWSVRQQAALFQQAKCILGFSGAAFTNLLFCSAGTRVLEILPERALERNYGGFWQQFSANFGLRHEQDIMQQQFYGTGKNESTYLVDPERFKEFIMKDECNESLLPR